MYRYFFEAAGSLSKKADAFDSALKSMQNRRMIMTRIKTGIIWVVNCLLVSGFLSPALCAGRFHPGGSRAAGACGSNPDNLYAADGQAI